MKKIIAFFSIMVLAFVAIAQTTPTEVTPDAYITDAYYQTLYGTSSDTLTNADTLNFVYRVKGIENLDIKVGLYSDFVSGSAGGTLIGYGSLDGVNYISLGDTITVTALEADAFDSETLDYTDYNWPYLKFTYLQSGTAVTVPKIYVYAKF